MTVPSLLEILAEAVNEVADCPSLEVVSFASPFHGSLGFRVGVRLWQVELRDLVLEMPEVGSKLEELHGLPCKSVPLEPYPLDARSREIHVRRALLKSATVIWKRSGQEATAFWATILGRLHAGVVDYRPGHVIGHDSLGFPMSRQ